MVPLLVTVESTSNAGGHDHRAGHQLFWITLGQWIGGTLTQFPDEPLTVSAGVADEAC